MASNGQINLTPVSVDNGTIYACAAASGSCYPTAGLTRGAISNTIAFNWSLGDDGMFSLAFSGRTAGGDWCVCSTQGYTLDVDFSADRSNWVNIMHSWANVNPSCYSPCNSANRGFVPTIAQTLSNGLTPVRLTQSGYIRVRMWTPSACPTCGCGYVGGCFPNAFPNDAASTYPDSSIWIDVSWTATIRYDANGGTNAPADTTATVSGDSTTLTVTSAVPTRTNWRFEGWADSPTAREPQYHAGDRITIYKSSPTKVLYAVWEEYYRPGAILNSNSEWKTHNRDPQGAANIWTGSDWKEMRTIKGPIETGDNPQMRHSGEYRNMRKIGST